MSNKRIDMTQFEGHTEGPWLHCKSPVNGGEQFWSVVDHTQDTDVGDDTLGNWRIADIVDYEVDAKLLAAGPTLLAELIRCYERIDNAESALREIWDHQINNVGGYNVTEILQYYKNAYGLNIEPEEQ